MRYNGVVDAMRVELRRLVKKAGVESVKNGVWG